MRVVYKRCAGLDVHKKTVVACRVRINEANEWEQEVRTFGTMTCDLLALLDWLLAWEVTHVAMESTGEYWKPVYNLLEGHLEVLLVNAKHVKSVPGRKTDVKDAEWLAELLVHGLLKASFIPAKPQRDLRDLTRYRVNLVQERARVIQRLQKVLENANIKLASVATDVLGVSGRRMLDELVAGHADAATMAELAKGRLRNKLPALEKALTGIVATHHRFLLAQHLVHIDFLDEQIEQVSQQITQQIAAMPPLPPETPDADNEQPPAQTQETAEAQSAPLTWQAAIDLLDTAPGVDQKLAQQVLAEMGIDMQQFPTAGHFAAWAGLAPGNRQSGGKRYAARLSDGNQTLRTILVQGAWAAVRTKDTYLSALYRRLSARRGKKRAIVAVAHSLGVSFYHMLARRQPYQELGADYFDQRSKGVKTDWLIKQFHKLGYNVSLEPLLLAA
ncbi:MAG: IS110 family transposase [Caldilineaceae bacterium]|nr:IS110 family transposase [Caldilineaceae bacterium]